MKFTSVLLVLSTFLLSVSCNSIVYPVNGTNVRPGQPFQFGYSQRGDRVSESGGYSVYLYTSPPDNPLADLYSGNAYGFYFGRFKGSSRFDPNPPNPPPTSLVMPDFSASAYNGGATATNLYVYLVVIEDWSYTLVVGNGTAGRSLVVSGNWLIYNGTG